MAEATASLRYAHISAQKTRLIADLVRGLPVERALNILKFTNKKAAGIIKRVLESAIANAEHNVGADVDDLRISAIFVNGGPIAKRMHARAKGRGSHVLKRTSHITVTVADK